MIEGTYSGVEGLGFRVLGFGFWVLGFGFWVWVQCLGLLEGSWVVRSRVMA